MLVAMLWWHLPSGVYPNPQDCGSQYGMCHWGTHLLLVVVIFQGYEGREEQWEDISSKFNLYIIREYFNGLFSNIYLEFSIFMYLLLTLSFYKYILPCMWSLRSEYCGINTPWFK